MRFLKHILVTLAFIPALSIAQVPVLGFEIGTSTQQQIKSKLGKQTKIQDAGTNKYTGGVQFKTDGKGYDIDTLSEVFYIFDKNQKLAGVLMDMSNARFDDIFSILSGKYKTTESQRPFVGNKYARFKANGVSIEIDAPHMSFVMQVRYIRDDLYQQFNTQTAQETQQKQASEKSKF